MTLPLPVAIAAALAVAWAGAAAFHPALRLGRRPRTAVLVALAAAILAAPYLIDPQARLARFLAAIHAGFFVVGLYDLHLEVARSGRRPSLGRTARFLPHPLHLVYRRIGEEPGPGRRGNLVRLARAAIETSLGLVALWLAYRYDDALVATGGFWLEHTVKVFALYPALDGAVVGLTAAWRLAGGVATDAYRDPILAVSPADFWRRYNRVVGRFLLDDVARPIGGLRRPLLGVAAAFLASAVLHEYLFLVALGEVQGWQTAFFLVQGAGVAATHRLAPRAPTARVLAIAATLAFNLVTLPLFFASMDQVVPCYDSWNPRRPF